MARLARRVNLYEAGTADLTQSDPAAMIHDDDAWPIDTKLTDSKSADPLTNSQKVIRLPIELRTPGAKIRLHSVGERFLVPAVDQEPKEL